MPETEEWDTFIALVGMLEERQYSSLPTTAYWGFVCPFDHCDATAARVYSLDDAQQKAREHLEAFHA